MRLFIEIGRIKVSLLNIKWYFLCYSDCRDALTTTLSALYGKLLVVMGIAFPMAEVISTYVPPSFYEASIIFHSSISPVEISNSTSPGGLIEAICMRPLPHHFGTCNAHPQKYAKLVLGDVLSPADFSIPSQEKKLTRVVFFCFLLGRGSTSTSTSAACCSCFACTPLC